MLKRNLKYAWNNLFRKNFLGIGNILLLAFVIATTLHLFKYIAFEKSYDKFHTRFNNIYRLNTQIIASSETNEYATTLGFEAAMMKQKISGVRDFARITPLSDGCTIVYGDVVYRENRVYEVDSTFFNVFTFPLLTGDPAQVLSRPGSVVLTETMAKKYFKNENPIGKTVKIKGKYGTFSFEITGICKDFPVNSQIQMDWICSNYHLFKIPAQYYDFDKAMNHWTYLVLNNNVNPASVAAQTNAELAKMQIYKTSQVKASLTPMSDVHLRSELQFELDAEQGGNYQTILLLEAIGIVCFLITYLNFINISVVKTIDRAKEVGIRRVMGAEFKHNLMLFFTEALFQIILALIIGLGLYLATMKLMAHYFNFMYATASTGKEYWFYAGGIAAFLLITVLTSFIYALIFSRIKPIDVLKRSGKSLSGRFSLKSIPVIVQFTICVFFLSFTMMVFKQLNFMLNKDLGYKKDNIIFIVQPHLEDWWNMPTKMAVFDQEAEKDPNVISITRSVYSPGSNGYAQWGGVTNEKIGQGNYVLFAHNEVQYNFFELYNMKLVAGRFFDKSSDKDDILVNYTACQRLGYKDPISILGKQIYVKHKNANKRVIGVVADFNQESLKFTVQPVVFHLEKENMRHTAAVKISGTNPAAAIRHLKDTWMKVFPESEFVYSVFTDDVAKLYSNETKLQKWLKFFCSLTLLVCSFCLFMLTYYTFKEREKEVAIHKVLGAGVFDIMKLSRNFLKFILISLILGFTISVFLSTAWLRNYAYHIDLDIWFFLVPILVVMTFYLITLFYSVYKTISVNPIRTLRVE